MTTNKPEVKRYTPAYSVDSVMRGHLFMEESGQGSWVALEDYEALQAEYEQLRKYAAFYRRLRSLTYEQLGQPGVPCVAVPEADNRGRYVAGEDLDAAMQEGRQ